MLKIKILLDLEIDFKTTIELVVEGNPRTECTEKGTNMIQKYSDFGLESNPRTPRTGKWRDNKRI